MARNMIHSAPQTISSTARGVIFDLDGTLADTLRDIAGALNFALRAMHRPDAPLDAIRAWVGEGLPTLCRRAWPEADETQLKQLVQIARERYAAHPTDGTELYLGVAEMLADLADRGVPLAVLSNKPHDLTLVTVRNLGIAHRFTDIRGYVSEDEKKPSPAVPRAIAAGWRIPADRVIFVGDSGTDYATALAAGMMPVLVTWGFRTRDELLAVGATRLIDHPRELTALVSALD
jgi:phosphoglycolate phosphatase